MIKNLSKMFDFEIASFYYRKRFIYLLYYLFYLFFI